jgi:hypothetical protein
MKKVNAIILIESIILLSLTAIGLLQMADINNFWEMNFESLINIFITASIGVIGFYITISIIENNASKRKKLDFLEAQLYKLSILLESDTVKLTINADCKYPGVEDFLSHTQKMRDIISNIDHFLAIIDFSKEQFASLIKNFDEFNKISDFYCDEAIKKGYKQINQRREDMLQIVSTILIKVYDAY